MKWRKPKRLNSVLGLTLSHGQFRAFHVARNKTGVEVVKSASAPLTLDLLHPESELVGREIKNHLEAAGIKERACVVAVPAGWVMSQHNAVPAGLSAEDAASMLAMEAEKGFPCDPDQLQIAQSPHLAGQTQYVTQLAVRREQVEQLATALRSAGLKPLTFTLGLPSLPGVIAAPAAGRITLRLETTGATLLVSVGGGIAAFRTFDASVDTEAGERLINGRAIAREVRITFEQVPADLRREVQTLFLTGDDAMTRQLAEILGDWARDNGLTLERDMTTGRPIADQMAEQLATRCLTQGMFALEFLPPKQSRWSALMARYSSKRLATAGFAAGAVALLIALAFAWQEYERMTLRSEWETMQAQVVALEGVQNRIRDYRPFYDSGYRNLTILKRITESFPESGTVTAKSVEIRSPSLISISGTARDNAALLRTLDEIRKVKEVQGLKLEKIAGKAPNQQFTFTFRWNTTPTP